jgi:hypothetical protein
MKKVKLSFENLRVESFTTAATEQGDGTVFANMKTINDSCYPCPSAIDACPSSPHAATLPCNGCVGTELC